MICCACGHHKDKHRNFGCVACDCADYIPPKENYKNIGDLISLQRIEAFNIMNNNDLL